MRARARLPLRAAVAASAVLSAAVPAGAVVSRAGGWAADFLLLGVAARPSAMGDAFVGVYGDPANLFWNPSGLPGLEQFSLQLVHNRWLSGLEHSHIAFTAPMNHFVPDVWGGAGVSYATLQSGEEVRTLEDETGTMVGGNQGYFSVGDTVLTVGYGGQVTQTFSAGANLKMVNQKIDNDNATQMVADLGALSRSFVPGLTAGVVLTNVGPRFAGGYLPLTGKIGAALEIAEAPFRGTRLTLVGDVWMGFLSSDNRPKINFGGEYKFLVGGGAPGEPGAAHELSVRAGYRFNHYWFDPADGVSVGGGFAIAVGEGTYGADYAFAPHGTFGDTHRITLTGKF